MVQSSADSLLTLLNDLLDFSKIEAGRLELAQTDFSLRDCVGSTMQPLALRAEEAGLELLYSIKPDVPDFLIGDPSRLRQVVINLVFNAVKFTNEGEVVLRVAAEEAPESGAPDVELRFSVADTGIGIPEDEQADIFGVFSQVDSSSTRQHGGVGLGLAITEEIVHLMGGRIWVESTPGEGSNFQFTARFGLQDTQPDGIGTMLDELGGIRVLAVDDNATNRRILEETFSLWNMVVAVAEDAESGLMALSEAEEAGRPFQLLVSDVRMPGLDGFEFVDRLNALLRPRRIPVVLLTSGGTPGDATKAKERGVAAYLPKPIKQDDLRQAILMAMGAQVDPGRLITRHTLREDNRRLRVLVAEDNQVNQLLAGKLLEKWGYLPTVVGDGLEALAELAEQDFDLVLMDIQMPEMDGLEAARQIRSDESANGGHVPIIAMTAHAHAKDRERCLEAGMDEYVSKPIDATVLWDAIQTAVPRGEGTNVETTEEQGDAVSHTGRSFDEQVALARVAGDRELLREVAEIYLETYEDMVQGVRDAVAAGDAAALKSAAHLLKGTVSNFEARAATAAASELEQMGANDNLTDAQGQVEDLDREARRLADELAAYCA
jgi:CheY-like chemotaxis protein/HPt (histidine-containing phosphotransfer) domain-containing protein